MATTTSSLSGFFFIPSVSSVHVINDWLRKQGLKPSGAHFILSILTRLFINVRTGVFGRLGNIGAVVQQLDAVDGGSQNRTIGAQEAAGAQSEYLGTDYSFPLFVR